MAVIDFHSHVLPGLDDGSRNVEMSMDMLNLSAKQGVDIMIATPHFYASRHRVEDFAENREKAYERLCKSMPVLAPELKLGAEVAFFRGISRADKLNELTIEGTNLILLEMPFEPWSDSVIDELIELINETEYQIILAHLERYMGFVVNRKRFNQLFQLPLYVQINAESLLEWRKRRILLSMFKKSQAHFMGSDCHGITHRAPNLAKGREVLRKKLGEDFLKEMDNVGSRLLQIGGEIHV